MATGNHDRPPRGPFEIAAWPPHSCCLAVQTGAVEAADGACPGRWRHNAGPDRGHRVGTLNAAGIAPARSGRGYRFV